MSIWEKVKKLYLDLFGYNDELVELVAASPVLKLTAMGIDRYRIAEKLEVPVESVAEDVTNWSKGKLEGFTGWDEMLPYNPLVIYRKSKNKVDYLKRINRLNLDSETKLLSWNFVDIYIRYEATLEAKWL